MDMDAWAAAWERAFGLLLEFVAEHGHSKVPQSHRRAEFALGSWVKAQRELHQKGRLHEGRRQRLEQLPGWYWRQRPATVPRPHELVRNIRILKASTGDLP